MVMRALRSVEYDDSEKYDRARAMVAGPMSVEPPDYPPGLCFSMTMGDLEKAGGEGGMPDETMRFSAMGEVTNTFVGREDCRIEVELTQFAGDDGKFFELSQPACICFTAAELEKVDMSNDAERGDMLHIIGTARLESKTDSEFMGQMACLQITELNYVEDESEESREG